MTMENKLYFDLNITLSAKKCTPEQRSYIYRILNQLTFESDNMEYTTTDTNIYAVEDDSQGNT